jgi:NAD(P)H-hydrate epimerase
VAAIDPHMKLLTRETMGALIQPRQTDAHKGSFGHLLVLAGARGKSGAALLAASAALRVGTGLVTLGGPQSLLPIFASVLLEAMTVALPERTDGSLRMAPKALVQALQDRTAVAFGPGIGVSADTIKLTRWLLKHTQQPLLIDADGLNCVATDPNMLRHASSSVWPVVLTPHPGEMARLTKTNTAEVQANRLEVAQTFATQYHCCVVLKGARTVVAAPDGWTWINPTGNPGMASGGMGDVLAGVIGGLLAQGYTPHEACQLGVFVHGTAGDVVAHELGEIGMLARDVIERLPSGLRSVRQAAPVVESV